MSLLPRKALLAIAAVVDVAIHGGDKLVSAKTLAARHALPARHLEPLLQVLVREGILKGVRGPHGGYQLGRERKRITVDQILKAAGTIDEEEERRPPSSDLILEVVRPAIAQAEKSFLTALSRVTVEELVRKAEPLKQGDN